MNAENVKSQMRKGTLEYCILLLLKKEPAYYAIHTTMFILI